MVNSNVNALGVIFANTYDNLVPELVAERSMASIPFGGRYRLIDFTLSSMANAGIDNVSVIVRKNYHSLMDHLGAGREWDLTRKRGGLNIVPPFAERSVDFNKLIDAHVKSGADVTMVYNRAAIPEGARSDNYTIRLDDNDRVVEILSNDYRIGEQNLAMNIYVIERESLIHLIHDASVRGLVYFERDILARNLKLLNVHAYRFDGYVARVSDMKSYFDENMRLLQEGSMDALFGPAPIYTKIRDDNPTRYLEGSSVKNSLLADGCVIEGSVENSVLFRGCKIKKGAVVKNCVLMQDTVVEPNCNVEYVVTDKNVHITEDKKLTGTDTFPVFVAKGHSV